jgi:quercetin dioxygenase-like cupin family protein
MFVSNIKDVKKVKMDMPGAEKVLKQLIIGKDEGWDSHAMRLFTVAPGGHTPRHTHPEVYHVNFIVSGKGILHIDGKDYEIEQGSIAYVPGEKEHQYTNTSDEELVLICIVPAKGEYK